MVLMYYKQPYGDPTASVEVDRALGVSYTVVKEVYNQLDLLKSYKESWTALADYDKSLKTLNTTLNTISNANKLGTFIGHDMGRVGVKPTKEMFIGENFASALTRSWDNINKVADNITDVNRIALYLNCIKALAYITDQVEKTANNVDAIKELNSNFDVFNRVYLNLQEVLKVEGNLDIITSVNTAVNTYADIQANIEVFQHVHEYLHTLAAINANLSIYEKANLNLKTYLEILEFRYEITNLSDNINNIKTAAEIVEEQKDLVQKFTALLTIKDNITNVSDISESIKTLSENTPLFNVLYDNLLTYTSAVQNLDSIKECNLNREPLLNSISEVKKQMAKVTSDINTLYPYMDQTTKFIDTFNSNLPSNALLTDQDNRVNVLLGSIKKTDLDTYTQEFTAPSNGWFVNYYYGETKPNTEDIEAEVQESITKRGITVVLKLKKPQGYFDGNMQLYAAKGTILTISAKNLKALTGKVQFIKEAGDE